MNGAHFWGGGVGGVLKGVLRPGHHTKENCHWSVKKVQPLFIALSYCKEAHWPIRYTTLFISHFLLENIPYRSTMCALKNNQPINYLNCYFFQFIRQNRKELSWQSKICLSEWFNCEWLILHLHYYLLILKVTLVNIHAIFIPEYSMD